MGLRVDFFATLFTDADAVLVADVTDPPLANVEGESDVEGTLGPVFIDKFDTSGGTFETATVGVGGVIASDLPVLLLSMDCLLTILATGAEDELIPVDWDGENRFEFCIEEGTSVLILASDGGDDPLDDGDGVGGDLE